MKKILSIIIVTYNARDSINDLMVSLASQVNYNKAVVEYIFIDGCSTDQTVEIISSFNLKNSIIKVATDTGIYDAMNKGIKASSGKFLYFINSDDYLYDKFSISNILKSIDSLDKPRLLLFSYLIKGQKYTWRVDDFKVPCHQAAVFPASKILYSLKHGLYSDGEFINDNKHKFGFRVFNDLICVFTLGGQSNKSKLSKLIIGLDFLRATKVIIRQAIFLVFGEQNCREFIYKLRGLKKFGDKK